MGARFWEIDVLRGVAIVLMVAFHLFYDLNYFGICELDVYDGAGWYAARLTAGVFIFLVGLSLTLSCSRATLEGGRRPPFSKYLKRGLKIFSWGMLITLMTLLTLRDGFIFFGVLHLIGLSIILISPLVGRLSEERLMFLSLVFLIGGSVLQDMRFGFPWLLWLGLVPEGFYTLDYFPIFPWLGVALLGTVFGGLLYPGYSRSFSIPDLSGHKATRFFSALGRKSLLIYLLHQPAIIAILLVLGARMGPA